MAKKAKQVVVEEVKAVILDPDAKLAYHLKKGEEHLIEALKLFEKKVKPERHKDYVDRLTRAQELVTWLYREELIRIRGPIKITASVSRKRKK